MTLLHVLFALDGLQFLAPHLNLMCLLIPANNKDVENLLLLLGQILLNLLLVQELGTELERQRQSVLEGLPIGLDLNCMPVLKLAEGRAVFLLSLQQILVPLLVELLILLDVGLLTLFPLLCLIENQLTKAPIIILLLEFGNSILGHLSLDIFAFLFTSQSVILKDSTIKSDKIYLHEFLNVFFIWLLV